MIADLNRLVEHIEDRLAGGPGAEEIDVERLSSTLGTTEYHLRRMFSSLAGMPLSEYIRRRRMTAAAAEIIGGGELLGIAVRYGYGSAEAFGRAFRAVHGAGPAEVRSNGGPLRTQALLRFRLTVEGSTPMDTRIIHRPAFRLAGHATRVPLIHRGVNPHIQAHIASLPETEHLRLKALGNTEPAGLLQVTADVDPDFAEGSDLSYLHGVVVDTEAPLPEDLDVIEVPAGTWGVFHCEGPYPEALQSMWAATASDWFPSNPWRLAPGPSIVAILGRSADFSTASCELWLPIEHA
ncbi:AraC family transcriptional regulator [Leucobacter massiliensis]|uniref:AraC family transcriptional regulator n=1 Tax=Leucobacter massiliensis TaxID=1686285 RepID=A0A2S9QSB1_9MICO|nr:AraC family transcriptional regulator [Leucobacter massiliensis]PRI12480.1 AraC family transcriptional regulator [Leucobacter massiliensis]